MAPRPKRRKREKQAAAKRAKNKLTKKSSRVKQKKIVPVKKPPAGKLDPKFQKMGHIGKIPAPVDKWSLGLGASVPENKPFVIDGNGKALDIDDIDDLCKQTFYVAYNYVEATPKACAGLDLQPFVVRGVAEARKTADDLAEDCEEDGCTAVIQIDYEAWMCNASSKGGSSVNVEIVLRVECVEL